MSRRIRGILRRFSITYGWAAAAAVIALFVAAQPGSAVDFQGRIDTRYELQAGDNAFDNQVFQFHSFTLSFLSNLSLVWNGGIRKDFNNTINTVTVDGVEQTNIAFRGLADAVDVDQTIEYTIYSAYLKYTLGIYGALLGRIIPDPDYEFSSFDGLLLWATPNDWLRVEGFIGKPWHYGPLINVGGAVDLDTYWKADEVVTGVGSDFSFADSGLKLSLRYLRLQEETQLNTQVGAAPSTFLPVGNLSKARIMFSPLDTLNAGATAAFIDFNPRSAMAWANGSLEPYLTSFALNYAMQFIDISEISDQLTQFSAFLTASHPYLSASADVSKDFAELFGKPELLSNVELELSYEHRQPLNSSDLSTFNPQYDQLRVGTLLATRDRWSLLVYYNVLFSSGLVSTLQTVGGEIGKKWDPFDVRVGSSFNANVFETDYTATVVTDSFYAQEYYLKVKWNITRLWDLTVKGSYENVQLSSLTTAPTAGILVFAPATTLFSQPRNYFALDVRLGFRY